VAIGLHCLLPFSFCSGHCRSNHVRLHSAIGYLTPADKPNGLAEVTFAERDRNLEEARRRRLAANRLRWEVA